MNVARATLLVISSLTLGGSLALAQSSNLKQVRPAQPTSTQIAVTRDGRTVILKSDGTWEYAKETESVTKEDIVQSTILEVESDQISFVEKPILINATLNVGSSYMSGYYDAEATHYAFILRDEKYNSAYVYMKRGEQANELRKKLLANGGELKGSFTIKILKDRYRKGLSSLIAELIDYKVQADK